MTESGPWAVPPATVHLPTTGEPDSSGAHQIVARQVADDDLIITAYSDREQLVRCCGPQQPSVELHWDVVEDLRQQLDAVVVLDLPAYDSLEDFAEAVASRAASGSEIN